jgi:DNA polymerase III alpha subunit (gram-positive type)
MSQEMSFAQALNEARQIIVQQSNRIKSDLDRIKALQETIAAQTASLADADRIVKQKTSDADTAAEQLKTTLAKLEETRIAKEQCEAVIDRQGQRLTQMQQTISDFEKQLGEHSQRAQQLVTELEATRSQLPTQEDAEALAALASLLAAKKGAAAPAAKPVEENAVAAA